MDVKIIVLIIVVLTGSIYHFAYRNGVNDTIVRQEEDLVFMDSKVDSLTESISAVTHQANNWKSIADSLFTNPKIIKDTISIIVTEDGETIYDTLMVANAASHTLDYSGDNAIKVRKLFTAEGDTLQFDIHEWIDIDVNLDKDGVMYIFDKLRYQIKNVRLNWERKYIKTVDKGQIFFVGETQYDYNPEVNNNKQRLDGFVGIDIIFDERYGIGLKGNTTTVGLMFKYKLIGW